MPAFELDFCKTALSLQFEVNGFQIFPRGVPSMLLLIQMIQSQLHQESLQPLQP